MDIYSVQIYIELCPILIVGINLSGRAWSSVKNPPFPCCRLTDSPTSSTLTPATSPLTKFQILGKQLYLIQQEEPALHGDSSLEKILGLEKIAYVVSTSGSTRSPKIVRVPFASILPNIEDFRRLYEVTAADVIFLAAPLSFDPSAIDLYLSLSTGAALLTVPHNVKLSPELLAQTLRLNRVTILQCTPSLFLRFSERILETYLLARDTSLRVLALGGEPFPEVDFRKYPAIQAGKVRVFNLYGITEVSCWSAVEEVRFGSSGGGDEGKRRKIEVEVSLGTTLSETEVELRDEGGNVVRDGEGEIFIGSSTRISLIDDEQPLTPPVFRSTGDIGKLLNGKLYFLRRRDEVIKRFGHRVNMIELESVALETGIIRFATGLTDDGKLYLVISRNSEREEIREELMRMLRRKLDPYLVPDEIVEVDVLPSTSHDKLDKKALLKYIHNKKSEERIHPLPSLEEVCSFIETQWPHFCGNPQPPKSRDNFLLMGGKSISCVQLTVAVEKFAGRSYDRLVDFLINSSFEEVTDYLIGKSSSSIIADDAFSPGTVLPQSTLRDRSFLEISRGTNLVMEISSKPSTQNLSLSVLWKFNMVKCIDATPLLVRFEGNRLVAFIGSHSHQFSAVDVRLGTAVWTVQLGGRIESSAAISRCGQMVFVGCYDRCLYALSTQDGSHLWKFETGSEMKSSPFVSNCGRMVFAGSHDKHLYAVDTESGLQLWKSPIGNGSVFSSPHTDRKGNIIFAASLDGVAAALSLSGEILWKKAYGKPVFSSPLVLDDMVIFGCVDGSVCGFDFGGKEIFNYKSDSPIFSSFSCFLNPHPRIVFGSHDHHLHCVTTEGQLLWKSKFPSPIYATPFPFVHSGRGFVVSVSTNGRLKLLDAETGAEKGSFELPGEVFSSPIVFEDLVLVGCRDNNIYALKMRENCEETTDRLETL